MSGRAAGRVAGWATHVGWPVGVALVVAALGLLARSAGLQAHLVPATVGGFLLGVQATPRMRVHAGPWDPSPWDPWPLLVSCALIGTVLTCLGLGVVVPGACAAAGVYGVLTVPTPRRLLQTVACVVASSGLAFAAQALGWVDGVVGVLPGLLVGTALLSFSVPVLANVAAFSRRAQATAAALEAERRAHVAVLERAAAHDTLTGLLGRRGLEGPLRRAAATATAEAMTAVLYVDLDGFKAVNDTHGHRAGDELLTVLAARLSCARRGPAVVARTGGDEFVLVLTGLTEAAQAAVVAAGVRHDLEQDVVLADGTVVSVGASTGVAVAAGPRDPDELLSEADAAMYAQKRNRATRTA
ncbi:GGDEF domain-containing protein [Kineococcus sp. LSe6-4]|uniref:GGDEF domain-containing protein n=1 Tax=Kineococcus halophytocola TaxID=3234027 RepID=A0ABV4GYE1_9ACTN